MNATIRPELFIEDDILPQLIQYCRERHFEHFMLVADANTQAALGQCVEQALKATGYDVRTVVFTDQTEVVADEARLIEVLAHVDPNRAIGRWLRVHRRAACDRRSERDDRVCAADGGLCRSANLDGCAEADDRCGLRRYARQVHLARRLEDRASVLKPSHIFGLL